MFTKKCQLYIFRFFFGNLQFELDGILRSIQPGVAHCFGVNPPMYQSYQMPAADNSRLANRLLVQAAQLTKHA